MLKNILVDAVNYKVELTDEILVVDGQEAGAEVDYNLGVIKIRNEKAIGDGVRAKILMHEVMHALLHERGMIESAADERLVDELSAGIVNLVRTNPALVEFITNEGEQNFSEG